MATTAARRGLTYAQRKALGLILTAADRRYADDLAAEIKKHGGSAERWDRADKTPAICARVAQIVMGTRHTPGDALEQFYRYGEGGVLRGGKVWRRPESGPYARARNIARRKVR